MTTALPFDAGVVYDELAAMLIERGLPPNTMAPLILTIRADASGIDTIMETPLPPYVLAGRAKAELDALIAEFMADIAASGDPDCVALVIESRVLRRQCHRDQIPATLNLAEALATDPEAFDAVTVQLYRPDGIRLGVLPIGPGRTVAYGPLVGEVIAPPAAGDMH